VRHVEDGARYVYLPTVARADARRAALAHVVKTFFDGSVETAVATLVNVSKSKLTNAELDRLSQLIDQAKKQGK
jgi:predicted transcriptional regulator